MTNSTNAVPDPAEQARKYEHAVLNYEEAERQVVALLAAHGDSARQLSPTAFQQYRQLAEQRDEAYDVMKRLESGLLDE